MTSSFCKEPLLAPGAEPRKGGKSGSLACGRPPRREHRPRQGAAPSLPAAGGGRLKGAAWRRLKAKQLLIYNVAEREMVAKKDKDAGIAGILQPPRLRRVKPLECVCVAGGGSALPPSGCPPIPSVRAGEQQGQEGWRWRCPRVPRRPRSSVRIGTVGCKSAPAPNPPGCFWSRIGPAATLPGRGQARRCSQGRAGGQSASVFELRAWLGLSEKLS